MAGGKLLISLTDAPLLLIYLFLLWMLLMVLILSPILCNLTMPCETFLAMLFGCCSDF
jgi:hypothetical protein